MSVRGLTASTLGGNRPMREAREIINGHIEMIDTKILHAHTAGYNSIEYTLPTNIIVNGIDKSDAQLYIYSELVKIYNYPENEGGKGFVGTRFVHSGDKCFLLIRWQNNMCDIEREERTRILKDAMKKPNSGQ